MSEISWRKLPGLAWRNAPVVIDSIEQIQSLPFARDMENVMNEFSIAGFFCVQEVPQIIIIEQKTHGMDEIRRVHKALWNQGLARILVVLGPDLIRVFSIARTIESDNDREFEKRFLIQSIKAAAKAKSFEGIVYGVESGRLWEEQSKFFDPSERMENKRIDQVLLDNLQYSHGKLVERKLTSDQAQAALIQTMFVAYLEDRGIIDEDYISKSTDEEHNSFASVLQSGDINSYQMLFARLKKDFNGDLFIAPFSFTAAKSNVAPTAEILGILGQFRSGEIETESSHNRPQFCKYDFRFIPIALISEVYDSFLSQNSGTQKSIGTFYTPVFLVDTIISSIWQDIESEIKQNGIFLDPACGSGVFLVRCFQRLCQYMDVKKSKNSWQASLSIINRIKGCDVDEIAVRVAAFSLYLALLENESSPNIDRMLKNGRILPPLLDRTIKCADYFADDADHGEVDVVIGNPPWTSNKEFVKSGLNWCDTMKFPVPDRQLAWAFVWKAKQDLKENGKLALLLPAKSFLHNTSEKSVQARSKLFSETVVSKVINFSDIRRQLFKRSAYSAALIVLANSKSQTEEYELEYLVPKADLNSKTKQYITLSLVDKNRLLLSDVVNIPSIFTQQSWMSLPESRIFSFLQIFPQLSEFIKNSSEIKSHDKSSAAWMIGRGFEPTSQNNDSGSNRQVSESQILGNLRKLPKTFTPLVVASDDLETSNSSSVSRKGFERAFLAPRILIARGVKSKYNRLTVAYSEEPMSFSEGVFGICFPAEQADFAKFLTAVLNSKFAMWYMFHTASSIATSRKVLHQNEILSFRLPAPDDFPPNYRQEKNSVFNEIVSIMNRKLKEVTQKPVCLMDETLKEIDSLTYEYFGLSATEIVLLEETVDYIINTTQPRQNTNAEYLSQREFPLRQQYAKQLSHSLSLDLASENEGVSVELLAYNKDFGIVKILYCDVNSVKPYEENGANEFEEELNLIPESIEFFRDKNLQTLPNFRIFTDNCIYLIKPMKKRFWLRSAAIDDASKILNDIKDFELAQYREQKIGS